MDGYARAFYEQKLINAYLRKRGNAFQDFFADLMEKAHPGDFMRVCPWGSAGDWKNDGYLKSERTLFQVYAPNEMRAASAVAKIEEDFHGALAHWKEHFDRWVFVHNSERGLGPDVTKKLLELDAAHAVSVNSWGMEKLRLIVHGLSGDNLASLFGPAPTLKDILNLGLEELAPVLDQIGKMEAPQHPDLRPPPADKISRNCLSQHVATLLKAGMTRADLVRKYFTARPTCQDEIAESFRLRYEELRARGLNPDAIFGELQQHAGGALVPDPATQSAVLAVLAFFFEECDIFERDGEGDT